MPFKGQYAFIFMDNMGTGTAENVIAHEIAHGAFNLRHTFSEKNAYVLPENTTDNLMDYRGGSELNKYQWDYIHNPESMLFAWLEDEEEGALTQTPINEKFAKLFDNVSQNFDVYLSQIEELKTKKDSFKLNLNTTELKSDTTFLRQWGIRTEVMSKSSLDNRFGAIRKAHHLGRIGKIVLRSKHIYLGKYEIDVDAPTTGPLAPTKEKKSFDVAVYNNGTTLDIKNLTKLRVSNIQELIDKNNISYIYCDETFLLKNYIIIAFYVKEQTEPTLIIQVKKNSDDELFTTRRHWLEALNILYEPNKEVFADWNDNRSGISISNEIKDSVNYLEFVNGCVASGYFNADSVSPQPMKWMKENGLGTVSATFAGKEVTRIINEFAEVISKADSILKSEHETLYNSLVSTNKYSISYSGTQHMRGIAGTSLPSNHSFGAAVDFRVKYNPMYRVGYQTFEIALIEHVTGFRVNESNKSNSIVRDKSLEFLRAIHGNNYPVSVSNQTSIMRHYRIIRDNNIAVAALSGICDSAIVIQNFSNQRTDIINALNRHKSRAVFNVASITGVDSLVAHLNRVTGDTVPMKGDANIAAFFTERSSFITALGKNNSINDFITYFETQANSTDRNKNKLFEDGFADIEPEVYEAFNKAHKLVCKKIMGKELPIEWGGNFNSKIDAMHFGLATEFVKYLTNQPIKE
ncbi:MAG: M15 family metallopeptidase [Clostridiaceae bacterium]|nr:M15 family metallopeptidase [Clostridiaceae bacterium]